MSKIFLGIITLFITNFAMADKLYCNAGVTIYHSDYSASMQQSNGTRANFEYHSIIQTKSAETIVGYRGTDIQGVLGIPKNINGTVKVILELDGKMIPFSCNKNKGR